MFHGKVLTHLTNYRKHFIAPVGIGKTAKRGSFAALRMTRGEGEWMKFFCFFLFTKRRLFLPLSVLG